MTYFDKTTHTFIVRVWIEPRESRDAPPIWRGMVETMHDGERCYFDSMRQLDDFIGNHLKAMGAQILRLPGPREETRAGSPSSATQGPNPGE